MHKDRDKTFSHMLEHSDGNELIESPAEISIIGDDNFNLVLEIQLFDFAPGILTLIPGKRISQPCDPIFRGRMDEHAAPATADVEEGFTRAELEFPCDQFVLIQLACSSVSPEFLK